MLGARVLEARGTFDETLAAARALAERGTHVLVNSLNPDRVAGQKTAVHEIVEELGGPPDAFALPYGGGGNTTAYFAGLEDLGLRTPIVSVEAEDRPRTLASAIRIAEPVHADRVAGTGAQVVSASDDEIVSAWRELAEVEGVFCEPSSAAGLVSGSAGRRHRTRRRHAHRSRAQGRRERRALRAACEQGRSRPGRDRRRGAMIVRAPATSANLGPGFDCAGVALDLWNELELTEGEGVVVEGEGAGELPEDDTNLAVRAYALLADPVGKRFRFVNRIPLESGLGSSAAAIALGLCAAAPRRPTLELLALGVTLEPHADNLAAALVGGVTLTWEGRIARIAATLPLEPIAVVPAERVRTDAAREALPESVPHGDAAFTLARAALLGAAAASGWRDWFTAALEDRVHEPYRASALLDDVRRDLPAGAAGATLSGSGPTVIVWAEDAAACSAALEKRFPEHRVLPLAVSPRGARA